MRLKRQDMSMRIQHVSRLVFKNEIRTRQDTIEKWGHRKSKITASIASPDPIVIPGIESDWIKLCLLGTGEII